MAKARDRYYIRAWVWKDRHREYIPERIAEYDTLDEANSHYRQLTPNADDMGQIELWCCRVTRNGFEEDAERISMKDTYRGR